jgi:hypothetical protein
MPCKKSGETSPIHSAYAGTKTWTENIKLSALLRVEKLPYLSSFVASLSLSSLGVK